MAFNFFIALAFIKRKDISNFYEFFKQTEFMQENEELFRPFIKYFERQ